jgi:hypothetical protein
MGTYVTTQENIRLRLIKDDETWEYFLKYSNMGYAQHKIHYIFEQNYMTKDKFRRVAEQKMYANDFSVTVDSCFTSFMVNGRCPYSYGRYIDITFDGTVRSCPYALEGEYLPNGLFQNRDPTKELYTFRTSRRTIRCRKAVYQYSR